MLSANVIAITLRVLFPPNLRSVLALVPGCLTSLQRADIATATAHAYYWGRAARSLKIEASPDFLRANQHFVQVLGGLVLFHPTFRR